MYIGTFAHLAIQGTAVGPIHLNMVSCSIPHSGTQGNCCALEEGGGGGDYLFCLLLSVKLLLLSLEWESSD